MSAGFAERVQSAPEVDMLDVEKLLTDVFDPQPGEVALVMVDEPHGDVADTDEWRERRAMAERWRQSLASVGRRAGFEVRSLLTFPATGANNADLPATARLEGAEVDLKSTLLDSTLVIALTQFSATAPLAVLCDDKKDFRAASMPGVAPRMESTALAADYGKVARRCAAIAEAMEGAVLCDVEFSTGHRCWFDLRNRRPEVDDGALPRFKDGDRIINLPSGETFEVPYEGEIEGQPSWTAGTIPVVEDGEMVLFHVTENRVFLVEGDGAIAERYGQLFADDPARTNIAEVAFGVNDMAAVTGNVLEDEKAGFHWAFGRSDHLGGTVGVDEFRGPETVVHQDIVYATGNPVQIRRAALVHPDGHIVEVIADGAYQL
jgi:leucyl aminopeptidase (aminopeptidase T)